MKKIIFIKIGGSLITQKDTAYAIKYDVLKNIAKEIKTIYKTLPNDVGILLGNGAGSFGHYAASTYGIKRHSAIDSEEKRYGFTMVQNSVKKLNSEVVNELLNNRVPAVSHHPSSFLLALHGKCKKIFADSIMESLDRGMVPVIYGDIIHDVIFGSSIFSTEDIFSCLIKKFLIKGYEISKIIQMTVVDGVLDNESKIVPLITKSNFKEIKKHIYKPLGFDVTGGMLHKITSSLLLAKKGIKTYIIQGDLSENLTNAIEDKSFIGTVIK